MPTMFKTARNYTTDPSNGYTVCRYLCENAPTNQVRPKHLLDGHGYERWSVGNGQGWNWMGRLRTKHCPKCGGRMIPINEWQPKETA